MDITSASSVSAALAGAQTGSAVGTAVLKKALDLQAQNAMQMLESVPKPAQYNNPPNVGQSVDTFA
jgi:hypothetical protein